MIHQAWVVGCDECEDYIDNSYSSETEAERFLDHYGYIKRGNLILCAQCAAVTNTGASE